MAPSGASADSQPGRAAVLEVTCCELGPLFDSFWHNRSVAARVDFRAISYGFTMLTAEFLGDRFKEEVSAPRRLASRGLAPKAER